MPRRLLLSVLLLVSVIGAAAPSGFEEAKRELREHVYQDQNKGSGGELYCGCDWKWVGRSGGRVDFSSCGAVVST
jgi:deoxyribonuclease I